MDNDPGVIAVNLACMVDPDCALNAKQDAALTGYFHSNQMIVFEWLSTYPP